MVQLWFDFDEDLDGEDVLEVAEGTEGYCEEFGYVTFVGYGDDDRSEAVVLDEEGRRHVIFVEDVEWED